MLEKIQLLKEWVSTGQVVSKFRNRSEDDLITLINQLEIEAKKMDPQLPLGDVMAMLPDDKDISEIMMRDKGSSCTNETKGAKWLKSYLKRQLLKGN